MVEVTQALKPCPNPWCVPSETLRPELRWPGPLGALVECQSCGLQGPSFSPVVLNDDGEQVGTRDAASEAIAAWNTRAPAVSEEAGWQPIETAPRAAEVIMLAWREVMIPDGEPEWVISTGCWDPTFHGNWDDEADCQTHWGAWTNFSVGDWGSEEYAELQPTHWRPLPAPPSTPTEEPQS